MHSHVVMHGDCGRRRYRSNKTSEAWKEEEEKERTKIISHNTSNLHKHNNNDDADAHVRTTTRSIMQKSMGRQSLQHAKPG